MVWKEKDKKDWYASIGRKGGKKRTKAQKDAWKVNQEIGRLSRLERIQREKDGANASD